MASPTDVEREMRQVRPRRAWEVAVALGASLAMALTVLAAYATVTLGSTPTERATVAKALTGPAAPDPTVGPLPTDTYAAHVAFAAAREALPRNGDPSGNPYAGGSAASAVGVVVDSEDGYCTATVVDSPSGRVAVTAAHCVYLLASQVSDDEHPGYLKLDYFQPGLVGDEKPWGQFSIDGAWIDPEWRRSGDSRYDVAFLRLGTRDGRTPQSIVGAERIAFDRAIGEPAVVLGYPGEPPFDGTKLRRCSTPATGLEPYDRTLELRCRMNEGSSGGPWLTEFDEGTGRGTVMAVTSYRARDKDIVGGDRFGIAAHRLYTEADTNAPQR